MPDSKPTAAPPRRAGRPSIARWSAPPVTPEPEQCLEQARKRIAEATLQLLNPNLQSMVACEMSLRGVADDFKVLTKTLAGLTGDRGERMYAEIVETRKELEHAFGLYQRAAQFHSGMLRFASVRCSGYTRTGSPGRMSRAGQAFARA